MPKYSQNFLTNHSVVEKIIRASKRYTADFVVEIGGGKGFLTSSLFAEYRDKLTVIEVDIEMVKVLKSQFKNCMDFKLVHGDFLKLDLNKMFPHGSKVQFVGNLPYAVASPILQKILGYDGFTSAILMFQREVAQRIVAKEGSSKYGVLSLSVATRSQSKIIIDVDKKDFNPVPKVDSAVVEFKKLDDPVLKGERDQENFFKTVKAAFLYKRKTILNSLSISLKRSKEDIQNVLESVGIKPTYRPERIPLEKYIELSNLLKID
jgi:16S rRNA (adenine1518-N6/adenine1519-N6)-dimethyltransferase